MQYHIFLYTVANLLAVSLLALESPMLNGILLVFGILSIVFIGVAHGAIDNILYSKEEQNTLDFYIKYLLTFALFALFWFWLPDAALEVFLLVSAFHFGQSQFVEYDIQPAWKARLLYFTWGSLIFSFLFYFNNRELQLSQQAYWEDLEIMRVLIQYAPYYLWVNVLLLVLAVGLVAWSNPAFRQAWLKESSILLFVALSFGFLPTFVAFTLFFVLIHSLKVMGQEYAYCKTAFNVHNLRQFIRLFVPLTLCSILGTGVILLVVARLDRWDLMPDVLMILLSAITLPHAVVMDRFYSFSILRRY